MKRSVAIGLFGIIAGLLPLPALASSSTPPASAPAMSDQEINSLSSIERLTAMFSPQIQSTVNACWNQGKADLASGPGQNGWLACGDGTPAADVSYADYVSTVSDLLAASSLVGFYTVSVSEPRISPEMLVSFLSNAQGQSLLRDAVGAAIVQSQLLPPDASASNSLLTEEVLSRITSTLSSSTSLQGLLGTPEQYSQVVNNFCAAPGMTVEETQGLVPDLSSLQLFAICIQESGVSSELLQFLGQ